MEKEDYLINDSVIRKTQGINVKVKPRMTIYKHVVIRRPSKEVPDLSAHSFYRTLENDEEEEETFVLDPNFNKNAIKEKLKANSQIIGGEFKLASRFKRDDASELRSKSIRDPLTGSPVIEEHTSAANSPEIEDFSNSSPPEPRDYKNIFITGKAKIPAEILVSKDKFGVKLIEENFNKLVYDFLLTIFTDCAFSVENLYCYYNPYDQIFNGLIMGENVPISKCCEASILLVLSQNSGGKLICTYRYCIVKNICNFILTDTLRSFLAELNRKFPKKSRPVRSLTLSFHYTQNRSYKKVNEKFPITNKQTSLPKTSKSSKTAYIGFKTLRAPKDSLPIRINPLQHILDRNKCFMNSTEL
ncbi:unnamed protein product [Blepharisma stoltei]|uniref:Uncharacterized protein n=1 Tax=Blepharisma stoltei TaxID=1481888 RepID=A0AAU9JT84_9CILI|nr:unnamed protein product [Blepharisma stoltei]